MLLTVPFLCVADEPWVVSVPDLGGEGLSEAEAAGAHGLRIADLSEPTAPRKLGRFDALAPLAGATPVAIIGHYALLAARDLYVIDSADPASASLHLTHGSLGTIDYIVTKGRHACACNGTLGGLQACVLTWSTLYSVDLSNPGSPQSLSSFKLPDGACDLAGAGGFLYVNLGPGQLQVLDVADPSTLTPTGVFAFPAPKHILGCHDDGLRAYRFAPSPRAVDGAELRSTCYAYSMSKIILVSNRLSVSVQRRKGRLEFAQSMGGLATGLSSLEGTRQKLWIGWSGLASEEQLPDESRELENELRDHYDSIPVSLCTEDLNRFYVGFCNNVIWPLFHYFPTYATYDESFWDSYREVNRRYMEKVCAVAEPGDVLWVHDYQLMLLPRMLRDAIPQARIGFFLHIPFPSYEVFRLLPWRHELLNGMLGADLIGFHTYDYARHFISSVRRLLGIEDTAGYVRFRRRLCKVDVFPMGIDYQKYSGALNQPKIRRERERAAATLSGRKVVLSVDRLDYTKGIPQRLRAFDRFLERNPELRERVVLLLIVVPSRTRVPRYRSLKREVDELVSSINGRYGTIGWEPVRYFYRPFPYDRLTALYGLADVMLVTPLRDGMNLVAKEFVATRAGEESAGVLILSETAGAAKELGEAILINPNNVEEIAVAIETALAMDPEERAERNALMRERLSRYDIRYWARDFLEKLDSVVGLVKEQQARQVDDSIRRSLAERYRSARRRLLLLDYDGTLVPLSANPDRARPDPELLELLRSLAAQEGTEVVISSGRGRSRLAGWFEGLPISLIARHGVWHKRQGEDWQLIEPLNGDWKDILRPMLELHRDRTPGSSIEEGEYSMAWYYRKTEPELAAVRVSELKDTLYSLTRDLGLEVLEGTKFLEIKHMNVHKGRAVSRWLEQGDWDFLLAAGDDQTDEAMFTSLPEHGVSIKVGQDISSAAYFVESPEALRALLEEWSS